MPLTKPREGAVAGTADADNNTSSNLKICCEMPDKPGGDGGMPTPQRVFATTHDGGDDEENEKNGGVAWRVRKFTQMFSDPDAHMTFQERWSKRIGEVCG